MAWRKLLAVGLVGSAVAVGCTVNTTNNNNGGLDDGGATGGSSSGGGGSSNGGKGGSDTGGKGGTANGGGGTANGGTANGGSDAGGGDVCKVDSSDGECSTCIKTTCCDTYKACGSDASCGQSTTDDGEFLKFRACILGQFRDAGTVNVDDCAGQAASDGIALAFATRDLIACIRGTSDAGPQPCSEKCFQTTLP
jgi:hypothetical protein